MGPRPNSYMKGVYVGLGLEVVEKTTRPFLLLLGAGKRARGKEERRRAWSLGGGPEADLEAAEERASCRFELQEVSITFLFKV